MKQAHLHLIQWGLDQGYIIEVDIEGEPEYRGKSYKEAKDASEAGETGCIYLITGTGDTDYAWFGYLHDYNQKPDEKIYDYGICAVSESWQKAYDQHCSQAA
jgi:hypothetical protein